MRRILFGLLAIVLVFGQLAWPLPVYAATQTRAIQGEGSQTDVGSGGYVGGAADYTNLNDASDATYLRMVSAGYVHLYHCYNMVDFPEAGDISNIRLNARLKREDVGTSAKLYVRIGGTNYYGTQVNPSSSVWTDYYYDWATNPAGGDWTAASLNAAEFGVMLVAYQYSGHAIRTAYLDIVVTYTPFTAPTVSTSAATNINYTGGVHGATLHGDITDDGGIANDFRGFVWDTVSRADPGNTTPPATYSNNWTEAGSWNSPASFSHAITGLVVGTVYYFRAYAHNTQGWDYGSEESFETLDDPLIQTNAANNVAATTARLNALVIDDGNQACDVRFGYDNVTHAANFNAYATHTAWQNDTYISGQQPYVDLSALTVNEQYFFNVQICNDVSCVTGTELDFTTLSGVEAPTDFIAIPYATDMSLEWVRGVGSTLTLVRYKLGSYPTSTSDGTVAYFDSKSSVLLGGLTEGTTYYLMAWGYSGGLYSTGNATTMGTCLAASAALPDTLPAPTTPTGWWQAPDHTRMSGLPIYPLINGIADQYKMPYNTAWFLLAAFFAIIIGVIAYNRSHNPLMTIIIIATVCILESMMGIMSGWIAFPIAIAALGTAVVSWRA